ncbi:protein kinase domain-containing protein [Neobacillus sp. YIM B06451]|uniref:protein kinase domain-containing protein n=1 Tax=Neobacillus sp. YIM B06451 TaxID=3070994 RepID=UPI00292ED183|nr:PIG-L family deacetylase [Neobacillus sp. YIM B06451]
MAELTWGNYIIQMKQQGYGGSGLVYFGFDSIQKREIAVKKMSNIAKALRESWLMKSYGDYKGLVQFYDFFIHEGHAWIVMERVHGSVLKQYDLISSLKITINILKALNELHSKGILHADIGPRNILLTDRENCEIKLIDFGSSEVKDIKGVYRGKVKAWMAPFANEASDNYDLYATAAVCVYMINGDSKPSTLEDSRLRKILEKAMHEIPSKRYQTAKDFQNDLETYLKTIESEGKEDVRIKADKLMIVAHPDDEVLFGGGELIKEKGWKVICVTNGNNKERASEFKFVMKRLGAEYEIWDFPDVWKGDFDRPALTKKIKNELRGKDYKKIVTHNLHGEYGHTQHIALSEIVHSLCNKNLYVFGYGDKKLPENVLKEKLKLLHQYELFVFQKDYYMNLRELEYEKFTKVQDGKKHK